MPLVSIDPSPAGHVGSVVRALVAGGWAPVEAPRRGRLLRNQQLIVLRTPYRTVRLRVLAFKVGRSSRGRDHERRVEITTTYGHGLEPEPEFNDVVLGFDPETQIFVGLDPVRLRHGGRTSNASSFVDRVGLERTISSPFLVLTRQTHIFREGEHQAFFRPERLTEYLFNFTSIHSGTYQTAGSAGPGPLADDWAARPIGSVDRGAAAGRILNLGRADEPLLRAARLTPEALRTTDRPPPRRNRRQLHPEELRAIQLRQEENGLLGEEFVMASERARLADLGRDDLAARIEWVSRTSVGEGYDIRSYEGPDETPRYIEVKSTDGTSPTFEASANEWSRAAELRHQYCIYRVTNVRTAPTISAVLRDPVKMARDGSLVLSTSEWRIRIVAAP
ncbi:MAG TPA: DUF3883 domain-containing protein [Longimicrobium sp.]|nr:DUF3883 domain-containing protein [Longimicrobium sp.]